MWIVFGEIVGQIIWYSTKYVLFVMCYALLILCSVISQFVDCCVGFLRVLYILLFLCTLFLLGSVVHFLWCGCLYYQRLPCTLYHIFSMCIWVICVLVLIECDLLWHYQQVVTMVICIPWLISFGIYLWVTLW